MNSFWRRDPGTAVFLALVALVGMIYVVFEWTPSSYGIFLMQIGAPEKGPAWGTPRAIRADEWAFNTPLVQATVRNGFERINRTSFYREDLRNANGLPLKDWSLAFKPEMWAFFVMSPGRAFSIYWALWMCACLAGYALLFRQLGLNGWMAAAISLLIFFSGFAQFWWTTFAPEIAGYPWILLILFSAIPWWKKALLYGWTLPVIVLAYAYPAMMAELALISILLVAAIRPGWFREWRELAAIGIGGAAAAAVVWIYFADVWPVMRSTIYPGQRIAAPGTTPLASVLSQLLPYISFDLSSYRVLHGPNISESGAVGSFLPVLMLCLVPFGAFQKDRLASRGVFILIAGILGVTCWEIADVPRWIGHLLLWDQGPSERLLLSSGLLIVFASIAVLRSDQVSTHPARIGLFVAAGPLASIAVKALWGQTLAEWMPDAAICGFLIAAAAAACLSAERARIPMLLTAIAIANIYAFGRFNPLQPAKPIFETPETEMVRGLRQAQAASPENALIDGRFLGATLNGIGLRSVSHALMAPRLEIFRDYFPAMDADAFARVFNRYAYVRVTRDPVPDSPLAIQINVPAEAFEPVRDARTASVERGAGKDCAFAEGGSIERVLKDEGGLTIEGWALWRGEDSGQRLQLRSGRPIEVKKLETLRRPDVAEKNRDYAFTRSGFRLSVASAEKSPLRPEEITVTAWNTARGTVVVRGCGCP